jgi:predicted naringenin-chalcone synthase
MTFHITGIGTALPKELITQDDAARLAVELAGSFKSESSAVHALYRKAGVKKRHSTIITSSTNGKPASQDFFPIAEHPASRGPTTGERMRRYEDKAIELATSSATAALCDATTLPNEISHLVTVSCTGFSAPGIDLALIENLGLSRGISRTHLGFMGCHGALNGLRTAAALSRTQPPGRVLMCCVELCTLHHQYAADWQQIIANALFGDGAAAVVGETANAQYCSWHVAGHFSFVVPNTSELMAWRIGDNGFEMCLSPQVPHVIEGSLRAWLTEQLARYSLSIHDVKSWAIHPGGPRILTATADSLAIDHSFLEPSRTILEEFGNMSSPTVLFILQELRKQDNSLPCVALAFGPGVTIEAALIV